MDRREKWIGVQILEYLGIDPSRVSKAVIEILPLDIIHVTTVEIVKDVNGNLERNNQEIKTAVVSYEVIGFDEDEP